MSQFILQRISFDNTPVPGFVGVYGEHRFDAPHGYELHDWKVDNRGDALVFWKRKAGIPYVKSSGLLDDVTQSYFADADDEDSW